MLIKTKEGNGLVCQVYDDRKERNAICRSLKKKGRLSLKESRHSNPRRPADRFEVWYMQKPAS